VCARAREKKSNIICVRAPLHAHLMHYILIQINNVVRTHLSLSIYITHAGLSFLNNERAKRSLRANYESPAASAALLPERRVRLIIAPQILTLRIVCVCQGKQYRTRRVGVSYARSRLRQCVYCASGRRTECVCAGKQLIIAAQYTPQLYN
jgi:hypothetical protein